MRSPFIRIGRFAGLSGKQKAIFLWVVGGMLALVGSLILAGNILFRISASKAEGTIIDITETKGRYSTYVAVVRFEDAGGVTREVQIRSSSSTPLGNVGDRVRILYDQRNPNDAKIDNAIDLEIAPLLVLVLGIAAIGGGVFFRRRNGVELGGS